MNYRRFSLAVGLIGVICVVSAIAIASATDPAQGLSQIMTPFDEVQSGVGSLSADFTMITEGDLREEEN